MSMTLAEAINSAEASLDDGDKICGENKNWKGGGFRAEAIRVLLSQYQNTDCQHAETQTDVRQAEVTSCVNCNRNVSIVWLDRAGSLGPQTLRADLDAKPDVSGLVDALKIAERGLDCAEKTFGEMNLVGGRVAFVQTIHKQIVEALAASRPQPAETEQHHD